MIAENTTAHTTNTDPDRRSATRNDRRKQSRSGRRGDPHANWRRIAWLFVANALYLTTRTLPEAVKQWFRRTETLV